MWARLRQSFFNSCFSFSGMFFLFSTISSSSSNFAYSSSIVFCLAFRVSSTIFFASSREIFLFSKSSIFLYFKISKSTYEILNIKTKCSYKTFAVSLNRFAHLAAIILALIMKTNQGISGTIKILDSTCVPVCQLKNSKKHKVMQGLADYGKTGNGAYFGLKLHICATPLKRILSLKFTSGNTDDRKVVIGLTKELEGLFLADAGYISKKLAALFNQENKRMLFAKPRKNMKKLITEFQDKLYKVRSLVEINFRILKQFCGFITSLPKSADGYLANYIYSLLAYQIF